MAVTERSPLMTVPEAARALFRSEDIVRRMARDGRLQATRISGRWMINRTSVDRLLTRAGLPPT